ncbi:hypothetical protein FACS189494_02440 [Spirochaetia bacterium]|nr:hypothetical protein FACS189494_02440 [Spirochaetia bacterium]
MFPADRWAGAFFKVCGDEMQGWDEALAVLKAAFPVLLLKKNTPMGQAAAAQANVFLHDALKKSGYVETDSRAVETACSIVFLMVKKGHLKEAPLLLKEIEKELLAKKGIVEVGLEAAAQPEEAFLSRLQETLKIKTGAKQIKLTIKIDNSLIGGYKINYGSKKEDFSLSGELKQLKTALAAG